MSEIRIIAVGDIALNGVYHRMLQRSGAVYPFREVLPMWRDADLRIGNLESPTTSAIRFAPDKFTLRASPLAVASLKAAGFDCLCIANNHMMDFGAVGLIEVRAKLAEAGIPSVGAGPSHAEAVAPVILEIRGQRVGILAYCDVDQVSPLYAGPATAGVARWDARTCLNQIRQLRSTVDWVIVNMHWGVELSQLPSTQQREWARTLVDAGADVILGHHPHVLQPIEIVGHAVIAYSLGNFLFSGAYWRGVNSKGRNFSSQMCLHPLTRQTGWLEVTLHKAAAPSYSLHPALLIRDHRILPDPSPRRASQWRDLNRRLHVSDYAAEIESEMQFRETRTLSRRWMATWTRRFQVKLFHWGLNPWAVQEV